MLWRRYNKEEKVIGKAKRGKKAYETSWQGRTSTRSIHERFKDGLKNKRELNLYFHIPYCKSKCFYCDFNSCVDKTDTIKGYFTCILKELELYKSIHGSNIKSIFFGGGTPSFVDAGYIEKIIKKCGKLFNFKKDIEISIEGNPESLSYEKLLKYKAMGINRLSIGLQAWQDDILTKIGRIHSKDRFVNAFNNARKAGFENINIDLIFSLPGQKMGDWEQTLRNIIKLDTEHISCYSLTLEEGTKLHRQIEEGILEIPDEDIDREMYYMAEEMLEENGYKQYEISNFAKPGYECNHNLTYWTYQEYIGFGAGAHSFFDSKRTANVSQIEEYISNIKSGKLAYESAQEITVSEQISEYIITGLRLPKGINKKSFFKKFNVKLDKLFQDSISKLSEQGLLYEDRKSVRLTSKGIDLSNVVMREFV